MIDDLADREAIVKYIQERQNEDGGYTFCQGAGSNAQDTYYATETLRKLDAQPRNVKRTITFMQSLQHTDGSFDSVKVAYYVATVLSRLGAGLTKPISNFVESLRSLIGKFNNQEVYVEASSEFETLYYTVELLKKYGSLRNAIPLQKRLFEMQNSDGSFGDKRFSRIASTFYALKILKILGCDVRRLHGVLRWIRQCEVPSGGFTAEPKISPSFMVLEDTYYGVMALKVLNESCRHPKETLELIARFQNPNGGFRRSIFLGISDFESTYQAVSVMKELLQQV